MPLKTHLDEAPTLNLTPMIDVLFLLIIFFMVGTRFTDHESKIDLQIPSVGKIASNVPSTSKHTVHVFQDGRMLFNEQPVSLQQLQAKLEQAKTAGPAVSVAVRGDASGSFQNVASVLGACKAAGVRNMSVSVKAAPMKR